MTQAIENSGFEITEIFCGDAQGADLLGQTWAELNDIPVRHFPADWKNLKKSNAIVRSNHRGKYNARAGIDRNEDMAAEADALIAIWDGKSRGTSHMILEAHRQGLRVHVEMAS